MWCLKGAEAIFRKTRNYPTGSAVAVVVCYSTSYSTNYAWKCFFTVAVAVTLKRRGFLSLYHCFALLIKDMRQRT